MKITQITPGSGDNFYCENCLRDQALVRALQSQGHEITMVPLYLPIKPDYPEVSMDAPIFFGGVNVYLQQKLELFRKTPRWVDSLFDNRALLEKVSKKAGITSARELGETTISMLKGEEGYQTKELDRLLDWFSRDFIKTDIIILSNILLGGLAGVLKKGLGIPVISFLQDEEGFVDGLGEPYSSEAWELLNRCSKEIDGFISVSRAYSKRIAPRLGLDEKQIDTVYIGIDINEFRPAEFPADNPVIGFLSRMCPQRGLDTLVEAFILIRQMKGLENCRLQICGGKSQADEPFLRNLRSRLENAGALMDVTFMPEFLGEGRREWLRELTVLCVPEKEEVAYGLFAMEAQAAGVPVVVPRMGILPEMIELTGGGVLVDFNSPRFYAEVLAPLLLDTAFAHELGKKGRRGIEEHFNIKKTAANLVGLLERIIKEA